METARNLVREVLNEVADKTDWTVDIKYIMFTDFYKKAGVRGAYTHTKEGIVIVDDTYERMKSTLFHEIGHHVHERTVLGSTGNQKLMLDMHSIKMGFEEHRSTCRGLAQAFLRSYAAHCPYEFVAVTIETTFMRGDVHDHVKEQYYKFEGPTLPSDY